MLSGTGQDQKELEQILITNKGYFVTSPLQTGAPLRDFREVRTTINTGIPQHTHRRA